MNTKKLFKGAVGIAMAGAIVFSLTSCDSFLDITDPDIVVPESLTGEQGGDLFWAGALGDFAWAFTASSGGQAVYVGMFTDEYHLSGTFPTREEIDQREVNKLNGTLGGQFNRLHRARVAAKNAAETLAEIDPSDTRIAEMWNLNAYTYVMFGENYCSGVPFGDAPRQGDLVLGEPATTTETFDFAMARFDAALAAAGSDQDQQYMARVGKARVLMSLDRYSEAAGLVGSVPTSWAYDIQHSANSGRQENAHYDLGELQGRWSLSDNEGVNGLPFRSALDPRIPWEFSGKGFDEQTDQYLQMKFPAFDAAVTLASGHEARYIEAEAALASGDATTFIDKLNAVRADLGMGPVVDPGDADGRIDLLFYERGFTLFGEAHRLSDLRRQVRQYNRPISQVFPFGPFFKGGDYGPDVNFIIPQEEENNPNFVQCADRSA